DHLRCPDRDRRLHEGAAERLDGAHSALPDFGGAGAAGAGAGGVLAAGVALGEAAGEPPVLVPLAGAAR
ncbi:MAG: hypothetical protein P3A30_02705, partial [Gemmatimonadota bacterium]|nr:hypothetical protein [Gemmatimonadota bacterium]